MTLDQIIIRQNRIPFIKKTAGRITLYLAITVFAAFTIMPFLWMLSTSFKSQEAIKTLPIRWIPERPTADGYERVFNMQSFSFSRSIFNSFFLAIMSTGVGVMSSAMAGFVFAKLPFKGSGKLFGLFLATMMIPGTVTMVPNYMILKHMGLLDTFTGLILPSVSSPFGVFLMRQAIRGINNAYLESATIDGASLRRTFFAILFPMIQPTVSTLILLNFMGSWNSYMWPLLVLSSNNKQTLQTVLGTMAGQYGGNEHIQMAGAVITILPILMVYCLSQRYVDQGMAIGGLK